MRSTFHLMETAKRSLFAQQSALQTTGHNIANANTEGYSRQRVNMVATRPLEAPGLMRSNIPGQIGTGVEFDSITRIREQFLDDQFRNENKEFGSWSIQADTLDKLETTMNEPSDSGIQKVLAKFWNAWSDLAKDPENSTARKILRETGIALTDSLNFTSKKLQGLSADLTTNIDVKAHEINSLATAITNLNREINKVESLGDHANDLRDQRDLMTDQLSKIVNIQVQNTPQGYNISIGGDPLITGFTTVNVDGGTLASAVGRGSLNSGEVYGMVVSRDKYVADYQKQLDQLAVSIATGEVTVTIPEGSVLPDNTRVNVVTGSGTTNTVTLTGAARTIGPGGLTIKVAGLNGLHNLGYVLSGTPKAGGDFFSSSSAGGPITAANISLSANILASADNIASSMRTATVGGVETVVKGNNVLATLMSQLKDSTFKFPSNSIIGNGTINTFYSAMVGQLGVQSSEANRQLQNQLTLVQQVDNRRQSVSGVSLDEEMSNLIKFQHAYTAASRVVTTFDQLLDKVINGMGIVGR